MKQSEVNVIAPIKQGCRSQLESTLTTYQKYFYSGKSMSFSSLGVTHFCRWVIFDAIEEDGANYPERLFFESNFDGNSTEEYLRRFVSCSADLLDTIYSNCDGYPDASSITDELRVCYLMKFLHPTRVFFTGGPHRTVQRILDENRLRSEIRNYLDAGQFSKSKPLEIVNEIRQFIASREDLKWSLKKGTLPQTNWPALILFGIIMLPLIPFVLILLVFLRIFYERKEMPLGLEPGEVDIDHMTRLEKNEDFCFQNQFSQMLVMKQTLVRKLLLQFNLTLTQFLGKTLFSKGLLLGIPTIHFARWIMLDGNKRMFFTSNFDGSWQQYLGDFIDKAGWGLNGIYSASEKFPRTFFLFFGGAYNEQQFLAWSRYFQIPTQFWYSAYPNISIKNIINNSLIRNGIIDANSAKKATQLLQRF